MKPAWLKTQGRSFQMSRIILLDAGPLGIISNPRFSPQTLDCHQWAKERLASGAQVIISEVADYEVRRELLRANKTRGLARLNELKSRLAYLPITTNVMLRAAELWARARNMGKPTASDQALDADMILAAQAALLIEDGDSVTVATTNVSHLVLFVPAALWHEIT
jgi:predicted nucleic acid-binding protein